MKSETHKIQVAFKNGEIIDKTIFSIKCNNGIMYPLILQREGKKALNIDEFIRGFKF